MLTKTNFIKFLQCPKCLWLAVNRKELIPEVDDALQRVFDTGEEIETYAYKLFPDGVNAQTERYGKDIKKTKELMEKKTPVIYQPTASTEELFCRGDIMKLSQDGESWDIYEVKSTTQVKPVHISDISFQRICFMEAGYKMGKLYLVYINNEYVRNGEIEPKKLIAITDVTEEVLESEADIRKEIDNALLTLKKEEEFDQRILKQCHNPYDCPFIHYCWKDIPERSIYDMGGLSEGKLNMLLDEGIIEIKDIPREMITSSNLEQYEAEVSDKVLINHDKIKEKLEELEYPLYFLDYETFGHAVPLFDGYRPYQNMTVQYSLHVQETPDVEPKHCSYLAKDWGDPSYELAKDLNKRIGKKGNVIAWCMGFEKGRNKEMGEHYPEFRTFFADINERMVDAMEFFSKKYYVDKAFCGSASLKKVLPAFLPRLSYDDLNVQEGMEASNKWRDMIDPEKTSAEEKEQIYQDLEKYCERDTYAMVEIIKELRKIVRI